MNPQDPTPTAPAATPPPSDYVALATFDELPLSAETRRSIAEKGYTKPTPVQARALKPILERRDVIVRSKTGTGKTAAFGIPIAEMVDGATAAVQAIVLCNTRELALQVATEVAEIGKYKGVKVVAIYGGSSMDAQLRALEDGASVVVGTPGRIIDLLERRTLKLDKCRIAVLDEADEMLGVGFFDDVMRILSKAPKGHQTLLFSATLTPDIEQIIQTHLKDPETIMLSGDTYTVEGIRNIRYYANDGYPKPRNLLHMLEMENPESAIIFCNTRDDVNLVCTVLNRHGFDADKLSGELAQTDRERVMAKIKRGEVRFMVATDIAARGIDISDLTHVINYSLPEDPSIYLHRVGRTGRIGKTGTALSLVRGSELVTLTTLEKKFGIKFEEKQMPTPEEAHKLWSDAHVKELEAAVGATLYDAFIPLADDLKSRDGGQRLLAFALKYFFTHHRMEQAQAADVAEESRQVPTKKTELDERHREKREQSRKPKLEGADRPPRREEPRAAAPAAAKKNRLYIRLGTVHGLDAAGVKAAVAELVGVDAAVIQNVELRASGNSSWVDVNDDVVDTFVAASGRAWQDKAITIEVARPERDRKPREAGERTGGKRNRLFVGLGEDDGLDAEALKGELAALAGADPDGITLTEVKGGYSYVEVKEDTVDAFLRANGKQRGDKTVSVEVARPPTRTRSRR